MKQVRGKPISMYIGIPFTDVRDGFSGNVAYENDGRVGSYVDALCNEIAEYGKRFGRPIETISMGGISPGYLQPDYIAKIFATIRANFEILPDCEISIETYPKFCDFPRLLEYKKVGINRLSLSVLSFDDLSLKTLSAPHGAMEVISAIQNIRDVGFDNVNLDVMFNIPATVEMTDQGMMRDIRAEVTQLLRHAPFVTHISTYQLVPEEVSELGRRLEYQELLELDDDTAFDEEMELYDTVEEFGFKRYEVTNWAKPGFESKHAKIYWNVDNEYLGVGLSAAGLYGGVRYKNTEDLQTYLLRTDKVAEKSTRTKNQIVNELLILGLHTTDGVRISRLSKLGFDIYAERTREIMQLREHGLIKTSTQKIKATEDGMMVLNMIIDLLAIKE